MVYTKYWHMHVHNNIYLNRDVWGQGYNSFLLIFDDVEEMVFGIWIFLYGLEKNNQRWYEYTFSMKMMLICFLCYVIKTEKFKYI